MEEDTETFSTKSPELDDAMDKLREFMLENNITPDELREDLDDQKNGLLARVNGRKQSKLLKRETRINEVEEEVEKRRLEEGYEELSPYVTTVGSRPEIFKALSNNGVDFNDKQQLIDWLKKEHIAESPFTLSDLKDLEKQGKIKILTIDPRVPDRYILFSKFGEQDKADENVGMMLHISPNGYLLTKDGQLIEVSVDEEEKEVIVCLLSES